jgi:hypothetical protein
MNHPKSTGHLGSTTPEHNPLVPSILTEQFTYLLQHTQGCTDTCPDCSRLQRIADILFEPFQSAACGRATSSVPQHSSGRGMRTSQPIL